MELQVIVPRQLQQWNIKNCGLTGLCQNMGVKLLDSQPCQALQVPGFEFDTQ